MSPIRRPLRLLLAAALGCGLAAVSPHALARRGEPSTARTPEAARALAVLNQDTLPALEARRAAAMARQAALDAWFDGTRPTPEAALPELSGRPLLDPTAIWGALRALDARTEDRAAERVSPAPADLHPSDGAQLSAARTAALDAEDAAAARERRFWSGLLAAAERAEGLQVQAIRTRVADLQKRGPAPTDIGEDGPSDEEAAAGLARARTEAALVTLQAAAVRSATIPGDPTLDGLVRDDLDLLQGYLDRSVHPAPPPTPVVHDAADRLQRARPLTTVDLTDALQAWTRQMLEQEIAALAIEIGRLEAPSTPNAAEVAPLPVETATQQLEQARKIQREALAEVTALKRALNLDQTPDAALKPIDALRMQRVASLEKRSTLRLQQAERTLDRARRAAELNRTVQDTTDDDVAQAQADAAAKEAEAVRAEEQRSNETEIRQLMADFSKRRATILEARKAREDDTRALLDVHTVALQDQRTGLAAALSLGPLDQDRQNRLDTVYRDARNTVAGIRRDNARLRADLNTLLVDIAHQHTELPEPGNYDLPGADSTLITDLTQEIDQLHQALDRDIDIAERDLATSMDLLSNAKAFRRLARTHASAEARAVVQTRFVDELVHEIHEIPFVVLNVLRQGFTILRNLDTVLLDLGALASFFWGSIELVVLVLLWGLARERTGDWLRQGLTALRAVRPGDLGIVARMNDWVGSRGVAGNWLNLDPVLRPVLLLTIDFLAVAVVYRSLPGQWTYLSLALFIWLLRTAWRWSNQMVPVLLVGPGEDRPAARRVSEAGRIRALRTIRVILVWAVLTAVLSRVALEILDADRVVDLINAIGSFAGWIIAVVTLHVWSPALRRAVALDPDDALGRALVRQSETTLLRSPIAALALVVLTIRWASNTLNNIVERRSGLAWVSTALARQSLKNTDDAPTQPLSNNVRARIARFDPADVSTDAETALLAEAFEDWKHERRRGMVAVTGQRGSGKSRLIRRVPEIVGTADDSLPIHQVRLDRDIFNPADALAWLVTALAGRSESVEDSDTAITLLDRLPPTVFVIDDLHRCFLRAVGGYRGLREILTTMHAVSDRHFWICSFHGDNWAYLEGIGGAVNLGVFRSRVAMQPLAPSTLRDWLEAHTRKAGIEPTYDDLAAEGWIGSDPDRARERARNAYFRLLAEATRGNPRVALETWSQSLRKGDQEGQAAVVLFDQPDSEILAQGGKHALFVLAALVVHDGLEVRDLVRVLNLPEATCRSACRRLEGLGVLVSDSADQHYDIHLSWAPAVHRHLRRKHLLHRE